MLPVERDLALSAPRLPESSERDVWRFGAAIRVQGLLGPDPDDGCGGPTEEPDVLRVSGFYLRRL